MNISCFPSSSKTRYLKTPSWALGNTDTEVIEKNKIARLIHKKIIVSFSPGLTIKTHKTTTTFQWIFFSRIMLSVFRHTSTFTETYTVLCLFFLFPSILWSYLYSGKSGLETITTVINIYSVNKPYWSQQWYNLLLHVSIICAMSKAHDHIL